MNIVAVGLLAATQYSEVLTEHMTTSTGGALCSRNAFGCLIIAIHDPANADGCIAHVSPGTNEAPAKLPCAIL